MSKHLSHQRSIQLVLQLEQCMKPPVKKYPYDFLIYKSIKIKISTRGKQNTYKGNNNTSTKGTTKTRQKIENFKQEKENKWNGRNATKEER